jgi:hypothetical protein
LRCGGHPRRQEWLNSETSAGTPEACQPSCRRSDHGVSKLHCVFRFVMLCCCRVLQSSCVAPLPRFIVYDLEGVDAEYDQSKIRCAILCFPRWMIPLRHRYRPFARKLCFAGTAIRARLKNSGCQDLPSSFDNLMAKWRDLFWRPIYVLSVYAEVRRTSSNSCQTSLHPRARSLVPLADYFSSGSQENVSCLE